MATMAPSAPARGHWFNGGSFLLGTVVTVLVGIYPTYLVATSANTAMVVQQQTLSQVQTFETTGGQVDNAVRQVSDALATYKSPETGLRSLRDAIGAHSSAAFVLRDKLGNDYAPYMEKMSQLRRDADHAKNPRDGVAMWQSAVDLIALRKRNADRMNREATK